MTSEPKAGGLERLAHISLITLALVACAGLIIYVSGWRPQLIPPAPTTISERLIPKSPLLDGDVLSIYHGRLNAADPNDYEQSIRKQFNLSREDYLLTLARGNWLENRP